MNAAQVIEEIQKLPVDQRGEVLAFLNGPDDEASLRVALQCQRELENGSVQALSHEDVFSRARKVLKCK